MTQVSTLRPHRVRDFITTLNAFGEQSAETQDRLVHGGYAAPSRGGLALTSQGRNLLSSLLARLRSTPVYSTSFGGVFLDKDSLVAEDALAILVERDPDLAADLNYEGFGKATTHEGHRLAAMHLAGIDYTPDDRPTLREVLAEHAGQLGDVYADTYGDEERKAVKESVEKAFRDGGFTFRSRFESTEPFAGRRYAYLSSNGTEACIRMEWNPALFAELCAVGARPHGERRVGARHDKTAKKTINHEKVDYPHLRVGWRSSSQRAILNVLERERFLVSATLRCPIDVDLDRVLRSKRSAFIQARRTKGRDVSVVFFDLDGHGHKPFSDFMRRHLRGKHVCKLVKDGNYHLKEVWVTELNEKTAPDIAEALDRFAFARTVALDAAVRKAMPGPTPSGERERAGPRPGR